MLDTPKQVAAFKKLQTKRGGTAPSITSATDVQAKATAKKTALATAIKPLAGVVFPATISASITAINGYISALGLANDACNPLITDVKPHYQDVIELVNMAIGFECYLKGNSMALSTPFGLVDALGDSTIVKALQNAVTAYDNTAIIAAMTSIQTTLTPVTTPPVGGGQGTTTITPLTQTQIDALATAVAAQAATVSTMTTETPPVKTLADNASASITQAKTAYNDAIAITLIDVLRHDYPRMEAAVDALVHPDVIAALA